MSETGNMPNKTTHLTIEKGAGKGKEIAVPPAGVRIGRSSNNDIVIKDPALSRFHCRIFFKPNEGLWAMDLGSANQTTLNGKPLTESRLHPGDRLELGSATFKVISDIPADAPPEENKPPAVVDANAPELFDSENEDAPQKGQTGSSRAKRGPAGPLLKFVTLALGSLVIVLLIVAVIGNKTNAPAPPSYSDAMGSENIEIAYEKIQATPENIFRYALEIRNSKLSIQVNDLANNKHVSGNQEKKVAEDLLQSLAETIRLSGFFKLRPEYIGEMPNNHEIMELTITLGRRAHKVKVLNTLEPPEFKRIRELVEEFGLNELGLTSIALSPEQLLEHANNSALLGRRLYDQRDIRNENLALAIRALKETEWYLETIEPKPDFYKDIVRLRAECEENLEKRYQDLRFAAERAIRLREWEEATKHLRIICDTITDRADERYEYARKKLIEVQQRTRK